MGSTGPKGNDGKKGETGDSGPKGDTGPKGNDGVGLTLKPFHLNHHYVKGDYVFAKSIKGTHNSMYIAEKNFEAKKIPSEDIGNWEEFTAPRGQKGEKGATGANGVSIVGPTGPKGDQGNTGPQGLTGNDAGGWLDQNKKDAFDKLCEEISNSPRLKEIKYEVTKNCEHTAEED